MSVYDELERLQSAALKDPQLRDELLATRESDEPLTDFCRLARSKGYEIYEMDVIQAGEEFYAGMRRSINGGGENHSLLEGEDDYYSLFMAAIQ